MPRPPRAIAAGATYHLFSRGSNQLPIYFDDADFGDFLELLGVIVKRDGWQLLAYCLMPNHFHLLATVGEAGASNGMRDLNGGFSRRTSVKYGRSAHLFKNRFGLVRMETDGQLLWTARYIALNPVAAGIASHPGRWRWSSYRATAGYERRPAWLAVDELLKRLEGWGGDPRALYRRFADEGFTAVSDTVANLQQTVPSR